MRVLILITVATCAIAAPSELHSVLTPVVPAATVDPGDIQAAAINAKVSLEDQAQLAADLARERAEIELEERKEKALENEALIKEKNEEAFWNVEEQKWQAYEAVNTAVAKLDGAVAGNAGTLAKSALGVVVPSYIASYQPPVLAPFVSQVAYAAPVLPKFELKDQRTEEMRRDDEKKGEDRRDDVKRDEIRSEEERREEMRREEERREQMRREEERREQMRREQERLEEMRREEQRREEERRREEMRREEERREQMRREEERREEMRRNEERRPENAELVKTAEPLRAEEKPQDARPLDAKPLAFAAPLSAPLSVPLFVNPAFLQPVVYSYLHGQVAAPLAAPVAAPLAAPLATPLAAPVVLQRSSRGNGDVI